MGETLASRLDTGRRDTQGRRIFRKPTPVEEAALNERVVELYHEGYSVAAIAAHLELDDTSIGRRLRKLGVRVEKNRFTKRIPSSVPGLKLSTPSEKVLGESDLLLLAVEGLLTNLRSRNGRAKFAVACDEARARQAFEWLRTSARMLSDTADYLSEMAESALNPETSHRIATEGRDDIGSPPRPRKVLTSSR